MGGGAGIDADDPLATAPPPPPVPTMSFEEFLVFYAHKKKTNDTELQMQKVPPRLLCF